MTKISITMPDEMGNHIQSTMKARQFENTSEYFRHLVRQDQEQENKIAKLRNMLDEATASGISKFPISCETQKNDCIKMADNQALENKHYVGNSTYRYREKHDEEIKKKYAIDFSFPNLLVSGS